MMDGWKMTIGSIVTALAAALQWIDFDKDDPKSIAAKLLTALGAALLGIGVAGKADKMTAAMAKPVEVVSATPEAVRALKENPTVVAPPVPTPEKAAVLRRFGFERPTLS